MIKGSMGKRYHYFISAFCRLIGFLGLLIAYIVVKITVKPAIQWLNILLLCLSIGGLISGAFNFVMCGMTATGYKENKAWQIICLIVTCLSGGILGTTFSAVALATKIPNDEVENEKLIKIKK